MRAKSMPSSSTRMDAYNRGVQALEEFTGRVEKLWPKLSITCHNEGTSLFLALIGFRF